LCAPWVYTQSTGDQEHSLALQSAGNHAYAGKPGMEITRTYADDGKSGLTVRGAWRLRQLITEVQSGAPTSKSSLS